MVVRGALRGDGEVFRSAGCCGCDSFMIRFLFLLLLPARYDADYLQVSWYKYTYPYIIHVQSGSIAVGEA